MLGDWGTDVSAGDRQTLASSRFSDLSHVVVFQLTDVGDTVLQVTATDRDLRNQAFDYSIIPSNYSVRLYCVLLMTPGLAESS